MNYASISISLKELATILNLLIGYSELHISQYRNIDKEHVLDLVNRAQVTLKKLTEETSK